MSRPPFDEDEARRIIAETEAMMRSNREEYFQNEPVQEEYRTLLTRLEDRSNDDETPKPILPPGPFDLAAAQYRAQREAVPTNPNSPANPRPQFASLGMPTGVILPDDSAGDTTDHFSPDAIRNDAARAFGFNPADTKDEASASPQPYRVAQAGAFAKDPVGEAAKSFGPATGDINQPVQKISNPAVKVIEWLLDFDKYAGEVEQFTKSKAIAGTIIFNGKPRNTDQPANNAFAHAGLSALYAYDRGVDAAKSVGDGREKENHLEDSAYQAWRGVRNVLTFRRKDPLGDEKEHSLKLDTYKDLFNNSVGRQIGVAAKAAGLSRAEVLNEIHEALKNGKLIIDESVDPRVDRSFDGDPDNYRPPSRATR